MDFLKQLDMRTSMRHFVIERQISDHTLLEILTHAANAPSNNNAQPWKVVAIKSRPIIAQLKRLAFNQDQVAQAAAVLLILGDRKHYQTDPLIHMPVKALKPLPPLFIDNHTKST